MDSQKWFETLAQKLFQHPEVASALDVNIVAPDHITARFDEAPAKLGEIALELLDFKRLSIPPDSKLTGELVLRDGKIAGDVGIETATSALMAKIGPAIAVRGRLSLKDAAAMRLIEAGLLDGMIHGSLTYENGAGGGELRVEHPIYVGLPRLTPGLAKHGVSTPHPQGIAPLFAHFGFGPKGIRFTDLDARVDGATVRGTFTVDWTDDLGGQLDVELAEKLVRNSVLLGFPALLTRSVSLTVKLSGTIKNPGARVDPLKTLGVSDAVDAVKSAVDELFPGAPSDPQIDAILDRILDRDPKSEELIAQLVDRGIDPHEFDRLLDRRRRQRRVP
jgi:hypothetical protein